MCTAAVEMHTQRSDLWAQEGQEGEGGVNGDSGMEAYALTYVQQRACGAAV